MFTPTNGHDPKFDEYIVQISDWKPLGSKSCWMFLLSKFATPETRLERKTPSPFNQPKQNRALNRCMVGRGYFRAADSGELQPGGRTFFE